MAIELKIGTRGTREEFTDTYTEDFLKENGFRCVNKKTFSAFSTYAVHTKYGWLCSFNQYDVLTYIGDGIWDLKEYEKPKLTNEEKEILSELDKRF